MSSRRSVPSAVPSVLHNSSPAAWRQFPVVHGVTDGPATHMIPANSLVVCCLLPYSSRCNDHLASTPGPPGEQGIQGIQGLQGPLGKTAKMLIYRTIITNNKQIFCCKLIRRPLGHTREQESAFGMINKI